MNQPSARKRGRSAPPDRAQARQLFAEKRDDITLAFVDCHLPDVQGADLCAEMRAAVPQLPLLLTSAR